MKYLYTVIFLLLIILSGNTVHADIPQTPDSSTIDSSNTAETPNSVIDPGDTPIVNFYLAKVENVSNFYNKDLGSAKQHLWAEDVKLKFLSGSLKGQELTINNQGIIGINQNPQVSTGQYVVVGANPPDSDQPYSILDVYRIYTLYIVAGIFVLLVIIFGRWQGLSSLVALLVSIGILAFFVIPEILKGHDPLTITIIAAILIACVSLFLAHGFTKRTLYAFMAMVITLVITLGLAVYFVNKAKLVGLGTQDAQYLVVGGVNPDHLQGLLLSGIIIGTLGVLEDITTGQAAVVDELKKANPSLQFSELSLRALSVGREHIASLVHTLVLAYAGSSLLIFLLFAINQNQPMWVLFNSQYVGEELMRTLIGSISLVLAVPIATAIAAYFISHTRTSKVIDTVVLKKHHSRDRMVEEFFSKK